jgi:hypothetical protein
MAHFDPLTKQSNKITNIKYRKVYFAFHTNILDGSI